MKFLKLFVGGVFLSLVFTIYTASVLKLSCHLFSVFFLMLISSAVFICFLFFMLREFHGTDIIFWGLAVWACVLYYWTIRRPAISFDTWQIYDMSRYVFEDFGYMSMIRQHIVNTHYEMAFPPLFPFMTAIIDLISDMGIMSVFFVNFLFLMIFIAMLKGLGDESGQRLVFGLASVAFMCTSLFRNIFRGGLSQLPGFVFFIWIARFVIKENFSEKDCFFCILISGLGLMNRFDFLAVAGIFLLMLPFRITCFADGRKREIGFKDRFLWLGESILIMTVVCLPWIAYSVVRFGTLFVTDNGRRLINIEDTRPSTYFSAEAPALTVFDDFNAWFLAFKGRCLISYESLKNLIHDYYVVKYVALFLVCVIAAGLLCIFIKKICNLRKKIKVLGKRFLEKRNIGVMIVAIAAVGQEATFLLTGYEDTRYHILFLFLLNVWILCTVKKLIGYCCQTIRTPSVESYKKIMCGAVAVVFLVLLIHDEMRVLQKNSPYLLSQGLAGDDTVWKATVLSEKEEDIGFYLAKEKAECLVVYRKESTVNIPRLCSLIDTAAMISPSNISTENAASFVRDFHVDYIFSSDEDFNDIFFAAFKITETPVENLYKIEAEESGENKMEIRLYSKRKNNEIGNFKYCVANRTRFIAIRNHETIWIYRTRNRPNKNFSGSTI